MLEVCENAIDRIAKLKSRLESLEEPDAEMEAKARASENALLKLRRNIEKKSFGRMARLSPILDWYKRFFEHLFGT